MGLRQVEQGNFFIYCQIFALFDDFFSKWNVLKVMRNFEKSSKIAKNEEKPLLNLRSTHAFLAMILSHCEVGTLSGFLNKIFGEKSLIFD